MTQFLHTADAAVIPNDKIMKISAFHGALGDRSRIEARWDEVEHVRKRNTSESSHWNNVQVKKLKELQISRNDVSFREVNGVRLLTIEAVNALLLDSFESAGVPVEDRLSYRNFSGGKQTIAP